MPEAKQYDAIIIGTGQGGVPLAKAFARDGRRTAIVERELVGGTCINYGCTPTKTMVASARVAHLAGRASDYGVQVGPVSVDLKKVRQRKRAIVESFRTGSRRGLENTEGIELIQGEGRFRGPHEVEVRGSQGEKEVLRSELIVINTGGRPLIPSIQGLQEVDFLDSTSIMELDAVPGHLIVAGGGYIGLEFGQMFARFGSRVTLIQKHDQLLVREDRDVAEAMAVILQEDGVEILLNSNLEEVSSQGPGAIKSRLSQDGTAREISGSHLLLATGRVANTEALSLEAAGIQTDSRGFIRVNERLETNVEGVYAIGDVKGGPAFTHISYDDFRILEANLLKQNNVTIKDRLVPYAVFTDPQLGRVGITEKEARQRGLNVRVARLPMNYVARALEVDETRGFMKAVVNADDGRILGCAILGIEGGEIMSILEVAMMGKVPYPRIRDGIFAHPTLAESLNNLFMTLD